MMVATGQPCASKPSNGVQPDRVAMSSLLIVRRAFRSTTVKSASQPTASRPLSAMPKIRCGPWAVRSTNRSRLSLPEATWVSITGTSVCTPGMPEGDAGYGCSFSSFVCGAWSVPSTSTTPWAMPRQSPSWWRCSRIGGFIWA